MLSGKDASYCLLGLTLGVACLGCFSTGPKQPIDPPRPSAAGNGPRPPVDTQPASQLKIPGPPVSNSTTSSSRSTDLVPVVAQGPDFAKPVNAAPRPLPFTPPAAPA